MKITTYHTRRTVLSAMTLLWATGTAVAAGPATRHVYDELPQQSMEAHSPDYERLFHDPTSIAASCDGNCTGCGSLECNGAGGFFGGAEYLLIRPHFSEAVAFARGAAGPASLRTAAEALDFDYDSSMKVFAGYRGKGGEGELRFTYWHLHGETAVGASGLGPAEFIVDPFGNLFGIDPTGGAAPFYQPTGDSIATRASVELDVFDIDLGIPGCLKNESWSLDVLAGVRILNADQFYESVIRDAAGSVLAGGDYDVDFTGAGPRLGVGIERDFGQAEQFTCYLDGAGSLLLGQYDVAFGAAAGPFQAGQSEQMTRLIPVVDMEVGGAWRLTDCFTVSGGWMVQAWFDLGTSGGSFSGLFTGADDANIMSFDGMFLSAELAF